MLHDLHTQFSSSISSTVPQLRDSCYEIQINDLLFCLERSLLDHNATVRNDRHSQPPINPCPATGAILWENIGKNCFCFFLKISFVNGVEMFGIVVGQSLSALYAL